MRRFIYLFTLIVFMATVGRLLVPSALYWQRRRRPRHNLRGRFTIHTRLVSFQAIWFQKSPGCGLRLLSSKPKRSHNGKPYRLRF